MDGRTDTRRNPMAVDESAMHPGTTEAALDELAAGFRGELIRPGDSRYDQARSVFNAMIDRRPAIIARCNGAADGVDAVNFAPTSGPDGALPRARESVPRDS